MGESGTSGVAGEAVVGVPRSVRIDGHRLRVVVTGVGHPLLLVNGIGANIEMWAPLIRHLDGFEVIAFDLPGAGGSPAPRCPMSVARLAALTARMLEALGYPQVDALGVSFGGAVVQELCRHPGVVRRGVLAATLFGWGSLPGRVGAMAALVTPLRYYSPRYHDAIAGRLLGGEARGGGTVLQEHRAARFAQPPSVRGYMAQLAAGSTWTSLPWLHSLRQPLLVLAGDDDPIIRMANARMLAARLANGRLHIVRGGGHLFVLERAAEVAPLVREFLLDDVSSPGTSRATGTVT